jgi:hypothetical protein
MGKRKEQGTEQGPGAGGQGPGEETAAACPSFTLSADRPGHLRALILAEWGLTLADAQKVKRLIREFELWMEAHP